jgi:hypothetical protein
MKYWVYENWLHNYVNLHKENCQFCNFGKGPRVKGSEGRFGHWTGPYKSKQEAELVARKTGRELMSCSRCT